MQFSDWQSVLRIRIQNSKSLQIKAQELAGGKEVWRLKEGLGSLLWEDFKLALGDSVAPERLETMRSELLQCCDRPDDLVGIFPVGSQLSEAQVFDVRFRPSLGAFRAHTLFKQHLSPALKQAGGQVQAWIPLSAAESAKKRKRQASSPPETRPKSAAAPRRDSRPHRDTRPHRDSRRK